MSTNDSSPRSPTDDGSPDGPAVGADGTDTDRSARLGRRTFVKGLGAAGAATVGLSADNGFAQDAEAIAPLIGAGIVAGSVSVGWALREFNIVGADSPPTGLTAGALEQDVYQTIKTRASTNKSTIVDNRNILDGVKHTAYTDAKVAAIEALNAGDTEANVLAAAQGAIDSYQTTVRKNFLKTWVEAVNELQAVKSALDSHSNTSYSNVIGHYGSTLGFNQNGGNTANGPVTHTFPDGTTLDVPTIYMSKADDANGKIEYNPLVKDAFSNPGTVTVTATYDGNTVSYFNSDAWKGINDSMETTFQNVRNGIDTWVTSVYGDVQSGDIAISDLVTPRERASMLAQEEGINQAIADLISLNIPVDAEREATITVQNTGATLTGTFALTDSSDGPLEAGTTYDPSTFSGDVYFTTDMSLVEGDWSAYQSGVDGGNVTLTSEPYSGTAVELETTANETVAVDAGNWTATGNGTWYHDVSPELENDITSISSARFLSTADQTQYETIQLQGSFTVDELINTQTGESVTATSFDSSEPQTDSNYITQKEWDDLEEQNQKLIEKYENSQSGGGLDLGGLDMFGIPGEMVAVGAAAVIGFLTLGNN